MLSSNREPNPWGAPCASAGLRLLPLVVGAVWALTALSVEAAAPRLGLRIWRWGAGDLIANFVLYVALGVALRRRPLLFAAAVGAVLSTSIEILQLFYVDRYAAVADVAANTAGAAAGWVAARAGRGSWLWGIDPFPFGRGLVVGTAALFVAVIVCLSVPGKPADFANWDPRCRLIVGDELTRDRPWNGSIETLAVFDRALACRDVKSLSRGSVPVESLSPVFVAGPFAPVDSVRGDPLLGETAQREFHRRLVSSGRMSVYVRFRTGGEDQSGPARIAAYSKSAVAQNFAVLQQYRNVVFRLRTRTTVPGGYHPQTDTGPVLSKDREIRIAATYDGRSVRLFADGRYSSRLDLMARGKVAPFLSGAGLPASAAIAGAMMGLIWVGLAGRASPGFRALLVGAMGGTVGGIVLIAAGGAAAFPEFARWVPVVSAWGGAIVGGSLTARADE